MSRYEFLTQLEEQLRGYVSNQEIRESVNYYQGYIEEQIRAGYTEEEVLEELGSANSIAKSIIDARGHEADTETIYEETEAAPEENRNSSKVFHLEGWKSTVVLIGIILALVLFLAFAFKVVMALIPFVLPFAIILFMVKMFTGNR